MSTAFTESVTLFPLALTSAMNSACAGAAPKRSNGITSAMKANVRTNKDYSSSEKKNPPFGGYGGIMARQHQLHGTAVIHLD